ncbi:tyrosine-protein kinase Src42A isoform X2 [Hoplias malabaricus]|uniref:tyrosine-protein kinase Src42A isoform X2 n=1 Tax=Hoplias malabaricus TaxID=27720 RepID=UPI00346376FB
MGNCGCSCECCLPCCKKEEKKPIKPRRVMSRYEYHCRTLKDLKINRGDILEVIDETPHWLYVKKRTVNGDKQKGFVEEQGYVPKDFVKPLDSLEAKPWYFENVRNRIEAKRCLQRPENHEGAFLVWRSTETNYLYLSVKNGPHARHYKIREGEIEKQFYLVNQKTFPTLCELVDYYSNQERLCTRLNAPCVMLDRPSLPCLSYDALWEVDRSLLTKVEKLGSGEFAEVWHGVWNNMIDVAIKEFRVSNPEIQTEINIMKEIQHERLLQLYGVCTVNQPFCIVTELMKNGSLKKHLISHRMKKDIAFSLMIGFAVQVTEGMAYLESNNIVHRDLRADNILLTDMQFCKIADFGLAHFALPGDHEHTSVKIPVKWMAPEIFCGNKYTSQCDVWSFGILLTEIITYGNDPYPELDKIKCILAIRRGYRMECPSDCPLTLYEIMLLCWSTNPEDRPGFTALKHRLMALDPEPISELDSVDVELNKDSSDCLSEAN